MELGGKQRGQDAPEDEALKETRRHSQEHDSRVEEGRTGTTPEEERMQPNWSSIPGKRSKNRHGPNS